MGMNSDPNPSPTMATRIFLSEAMRRPFVVGDVVVQTWKIVARHGESKGPDSLTPRPPLPPRGEGEKESLTPRPPLPGVGEGEKESLTPRPPLPLRGEGEKDRRRAWAPRSPPSSSPSPPEVGEGAGG